uniref:Vacuole membrane protein 1 n=1 Tax=Neolamprologus brichardi TaxID=32507 RepID=A0A3Q4HIT4_NEOBR
MAKRGAEGELVQRRLGVKEQQNGELGEASGLPADGGRQTDSEEREALVLWKKPLLTLHYFTLELLITLKGWTWRLWQQRQTVFGLLILLILLSIAYRIEGAHTQYVCYMEKKTLWCAYWVGLGILSSVGLGTGLHTFLLYLVRRSSSFVFCFGNQCMSIHFPSSINMNETCEQGVGTAIGELPPYFMARAARLSGAEPDDEDYQEFEEMLDQAEATQVTRYSSSSSSSSFSVIILPLSYHLLSCIAHLFSIKRLFPKLFVIITFSKHIVEQMVSLIGAVPLLGAALQKPFREYLEAQKAKLHHLSGEGIPAEESWLSWLFEKLVVIMVCFFVCSIVNSMAQSYAKRKRQEKHSESKAE